MMEQIDFYFIEEEFQYIYNECLEKLLFANNSDYVEITIDDIFEINYYLDVFEIGKKVEIIIDNIDECGNKKYRLGRKRCSDSSFTVVEGGLVGYIRNITTINNRVMMKGNSLKKSRQYNNSTFSILLEIENDGEHNA